MIELAKTMDASLKPPWLPLSVWQEAREWYEQNVAAGTNAGSDPAMIVRLATDDRMQRVWEQRLIQADQEGARVLFGEAVFAASHCIVFSRTKLEDERAFLLKMVERLRRDTVFPAAAHHLSQTAAFYEKAAAHLFDEIRHPLAIDRDTGDPAARAFAITLTEKCRKLFGRPLYDCVRIMASVAFDREISLDTIQEWAKIRS
jgi:hypothetical protein